MPTPGSADEAAGGERVPLTPATWRNIFLANGGPEAVLRITEQFIALLDLAGPKS
jgi:hypothetical protein